MEYNIVSFNDINILKNIIKNTGLAKPISLSFDDADMCLYADNVSVTQKSEIFDNMDEVYLMHDGELNVLSVNRKGYEMFFNLGEWGYDTRIPESHLCLGTNPKKFGSQYFSQIELSQCVEDEEYIYIIKNLSKLSGPGAIARINRGLGANRAAKLERRDLLVKTFKGETIAYQGEDWLVISKIVKSDLNNEDKYEDIFYDVLNNFIRYALTIEYIIMKTKTDDKSKFIDSIKEISLHRTMCYGTCPVYTVTFRKDGSSTYIGEYFVDKVGEYTGKVDIMEFKRLARKIDAINFVDLEDSYTIDVTDCPSAVTSIAYGSDKKTVWNYAGSGPKDLKNLEKMIDKLESKVKWKKIRS